MAQRGRKGWIRLVLWGAAVALLGGCGSSSSSGSGSTPVPSITARTVTGVVLNASTGAAVPAAQLALGAVTTLAGGDGTFSFSDVQRVSQTIVVSAGDYITQDVVVLANEDQLTISLVPTAGGTNIDNPPGTNLRDR
jgi:hypothetical protein